MPTFIGSTLGRGESGTAPFPTTLEQDVSVSYLTVADINSRDGIPEWKRRAKMRVHVIDIDKDYRLGTDLTIAGQLWTEISGSLPSNVLLENDILDSEGYIKAALIKNLFINDAFVVADESSMLALTTVTGNAIIRTDTGSVYIKLNNDDPSDLSDFADITANTGAVTSVNGETGAVEITIDSLLQVAQNITDFNNQVGLSPSVSQNTSAISNLQSQIVDINNAISALESSKIISLYQTSTNYLVDNFVVATSPISNKKELFIVTTNVIDVSPYDNDGGDYYEKVGDYYTQDEIDTLITNTLNSANQYTDQKFSQLADLSNEGILGEVIDLSTRDSLTGGDVINGYILSKGDKIIATDIGIKKVYKFIGDPGDSGSSFWIYLYDYSAAYVTEEDFTSILDFTIPTSKTSHIINSSIHYTKANVLTHRYSHIKKHYLTADGINIPTFSSDFEIFNNNYLNVAGTINRIYFEYQPNGKILVDATYITS